MSAGLPSREDSLLGLRAAVSSLRPRVLVLPCVFHKDSSRARAGATLVTLFLLNHLFKGPASRDSHIEGVRGGDFHMWILERRCSTHNAVNGV